jgi:hypothetical protein
VSFLRNDFEADVWLRVGYDYQFRTLRAQGKLAFGPIEKQSIAMLDFAGDISKRGSGELTSSGGETD